GSHGNIGKIVGTSHGPVTGYHVDPSRFVVETPSPIPNRSVGVVTATPSPNRLYCPVVQVSGQSLLGVPSGKVPVDRAGLYTVEQLRTDQVASLDRLTRPFDVTGLGDVVLLDQRLDADTLIRGALLHSGLADMEARTEYYRQVFL